MVFRKISQDMKERALTLYSQGYLPKDLCHIFGFSERSLRRWKQNFLKLGSVIAPSSHLQGRPRKLDSDQISDLMAQLIVEPNMYLDEIQTWVAISHDIEISKGSLSKLIEDIGFSYKYLHKATKEWDEVQREDFREWAQETLVPEMIVTTDKSSKDDRTLYRRWGRSPSGMPATTDAQFIRGERYSLLAAMSVDGYVSAQVVEGSVDTAEFFDFIVGDVVSISLSHVPSTPLIPYDSSLRWIAFWVIKVCFFLTTAGYISVKNYEKPLSPRVRVHCVHRNVGLIKQQVAFWNLFQHTRPTSTQLRRVSAQVRKCRRR